tara:strand:+ start:21 stop:362 length:342 start_codon:yes stop_codon:yes gene_type:complete
MKQWYKAKQDLLQRSVRSKLGGKGAEEDESNQLRILIQVIKENEIHLDTITKMIQKQTRSTSQYADDGHHIADALHAYRETLAGFDGDNYVRSNVTAHLGLQSLLYAVMLQRI